MSRWLSFAITSLMLALLLTACGGGDDDEDPTATATTDAAEPATATATATRQPSGSDAEASPAASPTSEREATPTERATAPSRPIATEEPSEPAATETPSDGQAVSEIEAQLMEALIQPQDLTGDWTQDTFGLMEPDTDDDDELCGQPPFPDRDQRIAGVEAEYTLGDTDEPAFVVHNIVLFPEETAIEALAYAREISDCGEWTDPDGTTFTIQPLDGPEYGDESYSASMSFEIEGTPFYGEYTFIRIGGAIATLAFITVEGAEFTAYQALVEVAEQRLIDADLGSDGASIEMEQMLLSPDDVALIDSVNDWQLDDATDPTDEERFSVCDARSFPDVLGSVAESGQILTADEENGPFLMHSVVEMLAGDGPAAMEWIRSELSCSSWSDEDGDYEVTETGDLDVGDDTYWLIVTVTNPDDTSQTIQIGFGFTQIGDFISVVGFAAEGSIDPELFGGIMALGAEKVFAGTP